MFRRWISGFWRDYKEKIKQAMKVFGILIGIGLSVGVVFSALNRGDNTINVIVENTVYNPSKTVISGSDVSKKEFEQENNLVNEFVNYCNQKNYNQAYELLSDDCKEREFPKESDFIKKYCDKIFDTEKEYNLQSWITLENCVTYRIRYTDDFISTGEYKNSTKYEDYITVVTKNDEKKLNINNYIKTEEIGKKTKTEGMEIEVLEEDTYLNYIIYRINIKNTTNTEILLDRLNTNENTKLIAESGQTYKLETLNYTMIDFIIGANEEKEITVKFSKQYGSDVILDSIEFKKMIPDFRAYYKNMENYNNYKDVFIKL